MTTTMTLPRFTALVDAYGAEASRWPERERDAALALLAASPEARALREAAAHLDARLALPVAAPPPGLRAGVLRAIAAPTAGEGLAELLRALWRGMGGWRVAAPAFAASLALGVALGATLQPAATTNGNADLMQLALLDDGYTEFAP